MNGIESIGLAIACAALMSVPSAAAVDPTFAQFFNPTADRNIRWVNSAGGDLSTSGTGGRLYTTASSSGTDPAAALTQFQFLGSPLESLSFIEADFFMDITVGSGNPATRQGAVLAQPIPTGGFSFTTRAPITFGRSNFAAGANLLTATFSDGVIIGSGSTASFTGNTGSGALVFTSDFLDFSGTSLRDFSLSLTQISPSLRQVTTGGDRALRTFRAFSAGSFSSDPAPIAIPTGIPEPEAWGLMVVGFGLVGLKARRRNRPDGRFA